MESGQPRFSWTRFRAVALDYDGTLAEAGHVAPTVLDGLERMKASGRHLVLVTGRELEDLLGVFPQVRIFDRVVAENGGVLYRPATTDLTDLSHPPRKDFIEALRKKKVAPLSVGHVIVATRAAHRERVVETIRTLGIDLSVVFNKDAVMVLPPGINKSSGLRQAMSEFNLALDRVVCIGDAENDIDLFETCGCRIAVANAVPALKRRADLVTASAAGPGVVEAIDMLLTDQVSCRRGT